MERVQANRIYSLVVGTQERGIEITNLQIKFTVTKTSSNKDKKNKARVEIFNLSEENQKLLEAKYVTVSLKVGYASAMAEDEEMVTLFSGQVVTNETTRQGTLRSSRSGADIVTILVIDELYTELNGTMLSKYVPSGRKVKDVILATVEDFQEVARFEINGRGADTEVPDGYPISGSPRQVLDDLSNTYNIEWQIDQNVLYVADSDGTFSDNTEGVYEINDLSGLIGRPEFRSPDSKSRSVKKQNEEDSRDETTIQLSILLNPAITAGSVVKMNWGDMVGYYKVNEVEHVGDYRSSEWKSNLILSSKRVG